MGDDGRMAPAVPEPSELSELSSISSSLDQIARRVTALADSATAAKRDDVASNLIAVERALVGAVRRLERMLADPSSAPGTDERLGSPDAPTAPPRAPSGSGSGGGSRAPLVGTRWREPVPVANIAPWFSACHRASRTCHETLREPQSSQNLSRDGQRSASSQRSQRGRRAWQTLRP